MANAEHLKVLKRGVKAWNEWRYDQEVFGHESAYVDLTNTDLRGINLKGADLREADLHGTNLNGVDLKGANLYKADLTNTNLAETDLSNADLAGAKLRKANLEKAYLHKSYLRGANLCKATLKSAEFSEAILRGADLREADLRGANLRNANLRGANLQKALLCGAVLNDTNLGSANLSKADLRGTNLYRAHFTECILQETTFNGSVLSKTIFGSTDLSTCVGLDTVKVIGACIIDFQTLSNSKNISKDFLFKIGLPETYIEYLPDFYDEKPLRLFPVFISHSSADKDFTAKLYEALIERRVRVWYDEHSLKPGDEILDSIDKGINVYDKMILVCSKSSLDSWWVEEELGRIFEKERQYRKEHGKKHRLLIPITIDDEILNSKAPLAKSIRKRSIGKFQSWQDEQQFNKALKGLIAALNADRGDDKPISFL